MLGDLPGRGCPPTYRALHEGYLFQGQRPYKVPEDPRKIVGRKQIVHRACETRPFQLVLPLFITSTLPACASASAKGRGETDESLVGLAHSRDGLADHGQDTQHLVGGGLTNLRGHRSRGLEEGERVSGESGNRLQAEASTHAWFPRPESAWGF